MFDFLPDSIIPWLLGGLLLLALFTLSVTIKSWREAKRSPYYFLRIQASRKMQRYMVASIVLILLTVATSAYAWQAPQQTPDHVSLLNHAKPALDNVDLAGDREVENEETPDIVNISLTPNSERVVERLTADEGNLLLQPASLPEAFDQIEPEHELSGDTHLGAISFSLDISDDYKAIDPVGRFAEGFYTVYATFSYAGMSDGMSWSWAWQRNGQLVDGGNQVWSYGENGPGYIYFSPEEGFSSGDYSLAIWVNGEQQNQASFVVSEGIAASN